MLPAALLAGVTHEQFWHASMREIGERLDAASQLAEREANMGLRRAWWTAALSRKKRLPSLKSLLSRTVRRKATAEPPDLDAMRQSMAPDAKMDFEKRD